MVSPQSLKSALLAFLAASMLIVPSSVFAASQVTFFMQNWVNINLNDDPYVLPKMTITDSAGGELTAKNGFAIMINNKELRALWDKTVTRLTIDGVLRDVTYSSDLKRVIIPVQDNFTPGQKMTIEGLTIRVYDQGATYQNFFVDVNNDGVADVEGSNGFIIDQTNRRTDRTAPFEVDGLQYEYDAGKVKLTWVNPLDYDLDKILITSYITRADATKDQSVVAFDKSTTRYEDGLVRVGESIQYTVATKDYNGNTSLGKIVSVVVLETPPTVVNQNSVDAAPLVEQGEPDAATDDEISASLRDTVTDHDIAGIAKEGSGLSPDSEHVKDIVYLVKSGILKPNYRGNYRLLRHLKYGEFADMVGPFFDLEIPGMSKNSYYFAMKEHMPDLIPAEVRASDRVEREVAFKILLRLVELEAGDQKLVSDPSVLKWYITRKELAYWIVGLKEAKN